MIAAVGPHVSQLYRRVGSTNSIVESKADILRDNMISQPQ